MHRTDKFRRLLYMYADKGVYEFSVDSLNRNICMFCRVTDSTASRYIKEMEQLRLIELVPGKFKFRNIYCKSGDETDV